MLRLAVALMGGCLVAFILVGSTPVSADDKNPTNEEIMKKLHGKTGSHKLINKALPESGEPNWEDIAKHAKIYADLSALLEKNKPDKGDESGWKKVAHQYAMDAKALADAAVKKDKDGVKTIFTKLKESCEACHENHRP
jgi:cytochrome c556